MLFYFCAHLKILLKNSHKGVNLSECAASISELAESSTFKKYHFWAL